jgi:outer membrane protein TolC
MKIFLNLILITSVAAAFAQEVADPSHAGVAGTNALQLTPDFVNELVTEMATNHPAVLATRARTNAAGAAVGAVRSWEDPMARAGGVAAREDFRASDGDLIYGLEQKLPLFGKPGAARRLAQAGFVTESASAEYELQVLKRELAKAAFRTALADEVILLGTQDLTWLQTMSTSVEKKYGAGQATFIEALQVENERAKRNNQLQNDRNNQAHERVGLNRLLNRELHSPWPVLRLPPVAGPVVYNERLVRFALSNEPKIKLLRQQVRQAELAVEVTRRQRLPDVNVGLEGRNYSGDGSFRQGAAIVSMNLPWFNGRKYRSEVQRDEAKLKASEYDLADYVLSIREDVHHLALKIDSARREAILYRDEIIPRSESGLQSARSGWEANRNTFRDLIEARRMWVEGRLMYARAVAEQYELMSELVLCCGLGNLESLQMIDALPTEKEKE